MALTTATLTIDHSLLPQKYDKLGVRFERRSVTTLKAGAPPKDMVLLRPAGTLLAGDAAIGPEPRWNHILCGISIKTADGTEAHGQGQFIITGQRFIGMIDNGTAGGTSPLSAAKTGKIFCFSFGRDDVSPPEVKKHRLQPSDFTFVGQQGQPVRFRVLIFAGMAYVANDKIGYWHDKDMFRVLSDEGRQGLLKAT